jgi:hypothetical protein
MIESNGRAWTREELEFLYDQRQQDIRFEQIGQAIKRTGNACACKYKETNWEAFENGDIIAVNGEVQSSDWTDNELTWLYEQVKDRVPYRVIASQLNRSYQSCRRKFKETIWSDPRFNVLNNTKSRIRQRQLESFKDKTAKTVQTSLDRWRMRTDAIAGAFEETARELPAAPLVPWIPSKRVNAHSNEDMGLMLSDLHIGHEHSLEETGGISQYNVSIFQHRMNNLKVAIADIYELHSQLYKVPKLHIFSLGDVVDGMNEAGAWSPVYISTPITDQVMIGVRAMSDAIWYWLTIFEEIEFYGIRGNHGRIARSGAEKDYANWDIIIYQFLMTEFRNNPRIKFNVPKTWWHLASIRNHKFLLLHGDDVKAKDPPIKSFLEVERKMAGFVKDHSHYTLAGHFHNASELTSSNGKVLMNGSFVGSDVYSLQNRLPGTRAEQKVFGIHDSRGVTFRYDIDLDYERDLDKLIGGSPNDPAP